MSWKLGDWLYYIFLIVMAVLFACVVLSCTPSKKIPYKDLEMREVDIYRYQ